MRRARPLLQETGWRQEDAGSPFLQMAEVSHKCHCSE